MEEQVTGNEAVRNMEYLLELLHKEWECSGRTKAQAFLNKEDVKEAGERLAEEIQKRQGKSHMKEMTFQQSMELSKQNFILLRLAKKIKKEVDKAVQKETAAPFTVELDQEEYALFTTLVKVQEV